jgi:hypothetical protein
MFDGCLILGGAWLCNDVLGVRNAGFSLRVGGVLAIGCLVVGGVEVAMTTSGGFEGGVSSC